MSIIERTFTYRGNIKLSSEDMALARSGRKTCTIRLGRLGVAREVLNLSDGRTTLKVRITHVDSGRTYDQLTDDDAVADGLDSMQQLREDLHRFYGLIDPKQPMTIIYFKKLE